MMKRFSRKTLLTLDLEARKERCYELAKFLADTYMPQASQLPDGAEREDMVFSWIEELRAVGHDLWRWDFDEDYEFFGYNYAKQGSSGLLIEFEFPNKVEISWKEAGNSTPIIEVSSDN